MISKQPTFAITIMTERFLRKPLVETFVGVWDSKDEIERVLASFRPKAKLLNVYPLMPKFKEWLISKRQESANKTESELDEYSFDSIFNELIRECSILSDKKLEVT